MRNRRSRYLIVAASVVALASSCGSREPYSALQAALRTGPAAAGGPSVGAGSGTAVPAGSAAPGAAGSSDLSAGGSAVGGSTGGTASAAAQPGALSSPTTATGSGTSSGAATGGPASAAASPSAPAGGSPAPAADSASGVPGVEHCTSEKSPVVIGSVGTQSGVVGAAVAGGAKAVQAWAGYVNSLGGLRCHPIKYIVTDDGASPANNAAQTQQLVQQDHVVAFVYNDAPESASGSESYLVQHKIPIIGNEGAEQFMYDYPFFFPQAPNGNELGYATIAALRPLMSTAQAQAVGVIACIEAAQCTQAHDSASVYAAKAGMKVVYNGSASLTQPSFSSNCLSAIQAGVKALFLVLDPNSIERAATNCRQVGYTGLLLTGSTIVVSAQLGVPALNGLLFGTTVAPWTLTQNPQIQLLAKVLKQFEPGQDIAGSPSLGWAAAQLFAESSLYWPDHDQITSQDVIAAMDQVKNYDEQGMTGPLTFTAGQNAPQTACWWAMGIKNGAFVTTNPTRQCG